MILNFFYFYKFLIKFKTEGFENTKMSKTLKTIETRVSSYNLSNTCLCYTNTSKEDHIKPPCMNELISLMNCISTFPLNKEICYTKYETLKKCIENNLIK